MHRPVVGVIGNGHLIDERFAVQAVGERSLRAVAEVTGALPVMFAGAPEFTHVPALLELLDGVLLTGAAPMFTLLAGTPSLIHGMSPTTSAAIRSRLP
jgi:gamma-glutamyl-gamma-aminobutyrate hydrolase PuuD